jgi:hypothetical protein
MNLLKKMNFGQFNFIAHCHSADREDPEKMLTIVLNNGKIRQTLKIPVAYVDTKAERMKIENGIWVKFAYPSMQPVSHYKSAEEIIEVYIKLAANSDRLSMSEHTYGSIKRSLKKKQDKNPARYMGRIGVYDIYEEENTEENYIITTYFTRDKEGTFLSFRDDGYQINALRRCAGVLELSYFFMLSMRTQQLRIDAAIAKLVEGWVQK